MLMLNEPDKIFNASTCGDNCAKWILEIGKRQDITINLRHMMDFGMNTRFDIVIKNGRRGCTFYERINPCSQSVFKCHETGAGLNEGCT